jgi:hypothetical protein
MRKRVGKPSEDNTLVAAEDQAPVEAGKGVGYLSQPRRRHELPFGLPEWPTMHLVVFVLALVTRYYRLGDPRGVVFDEHHFGRFTNQYMRGTYFFDIHPPLGKLVFYLTAKIVGYDPDKCDYGSIHTLYPEDCKFIYLRIVAGESSCLSRRVLRMCCRSYVRVPDRTFGVLDCPAVGLSNARCSLCVVHVHL